MVTLRTVLRSSVGRKWEGEVALATDLIVAVKFIAFRPYGRKEDSLGEGFSDPQGRGTWWVRPCEGFGDTEGNCEEKHPAA